MATLTVMINGLSGAMGQEVAAACLRRGFNVADVALSGSSTGTVDIRPETGEPVAKTVTLLSSANETTFTELQTYIATVEGTLIVVDYTHPSCVNQNGALYARLKVPFVMGTTGGNREQLYTDIKKANIYAVIAANMCKQIVALQTVLETMSSEFPGAFSGYTLKVTESHQSHKADTSGTAKEMVKYFNDLTSSSFAIADVNKLRDTPSQLAFGVPEDSLQGHAFHTYELEAPDQTVHFQFQHNVCGRRTYAEGTVDAVQYLFNQITLDREEENNNKKKEETTAPKKMIFNMIDVLKSGAMR